MRPCLRGSLFHQRLAPISRAMLRLLDDFHYSVVNVFISSKWKEGNQIRFFTLQFGKRIMELI